MTDRRRHPGNGRRVLAGATPAGNERPVEGRVHRLVDQAWLLDRPGGARDRQVLAGDRVVRIDGDGETAFVRSDKDGYVGYLPEDALGPDWSPSHRVIRRTTWAFPRPDFKTQAVRDLHLCAPVAVVDMHGDWSEIRLGQSTAFVPSRHLGVSPLDPVAAARAYLGTPYVWAGNSGFGIDCSGLVQAAYHAAHLAMPADSDQQEAAPALGLQDDAPLNAGDLIFWKRHVALVTTPTTLIHANAHHMAVTEEPIDSAIQRIAASDTGPVTSIRRPERRPLSSG